ncbi:MAG: hypothetical protein KA248_00570 [Kiritimatiellae bacterium]|nr:hypothetical protein [Kiritimatiellia bacterium]
MSGRQACGLAGVLLLAAAAGRAGEGLIDPQEVEKAARTIEAAMTQISGPPPEVPVGRPASSWRVLLATLSMGPVEWIPDADLYAAKAQAEAVRQDARLLSLRGDRAAAIQKLEQFAEEWLPEPMAGKVLEDVVDLSFRVADYDRALKTLRKLMVQRGNDPVLICNLAAVKIQMGQYDEALGLLNSIDVLALRRADLLASIFFNRACIYSRLGRKEPAIAALYSAYTTLPEATVLWFTDPQLDPIRDDPRLSPLRKALNRARQKNPGGGLRVDWTLREAPGNDPLPRKAGDAALTLEAW